METVKILHTGDIHICAEESFLGEKAELRRRETLLTFERIIDLGVKNQVDLILIAGDLFHSNNIESSFVDGVLISSFQNSPKINNIKNDYSVWGSYNVSGTEIPIHMRYAIDNKPLSYKPIRPLKEEIHTIIEKDGIELSNTINYRYYDGPEMEPYNDEYLIKLTDFN